MTDPFVLSGFSDEIDTDIEVQLSHLQHHEDEAERLQRGYHNGLMLEFGVGVGTENGLGQSLGLRAQGIYIVAHLTIAEHYAHAATLMGFGFAKDADTGAVFLQGIYEVIVEQRAVNGCRSLLGREDDS